MSRGIVWAVIVAAAFAVSGCETSRRLASHGDLEQLPTTAPITVYARDRRVYELREHALAGSAIRGSGTVRGKSGTTPFSGAIPLDSVIAVTTGSRSALRSFLAVSVTALFVAAVVDGGHSGSGMTTGQTGHYQPPPTGGGVGSSCPYVYAWDGGRFVLEAEPFGVGWGKALELTTFHLLPSARAQGGVVRLRLTNERREVHYVNSLKLMAVDLGGAAAAVLDENGRAWPLARPVAPAAAHDRSGRDILADVTSVDARMWECDPASLTPGSGYEDVVELTFPRPRGASAGTLVLTGINTTLSTGMFRHLCRVAGDEVAGLAHAIETDPELIARLREYLDDSSLKVFIADGDGWEEVGVFRPEANAVTFARGLRIRLPEAAGDTVRVRLVSMADTWRIDAVSADWADATMLPMKPLELLSATGPDGEDLTGRLRDDDSRYAMLLPPDRVDLSFVAAGPSSGGRVLYAVAGRGYLHEWMPEVPGMEQAAFATMAPTGLGLDGVKELLKHREVALRPVYEEWRKARSH